MTPPGFTEDSQPLPAGQGIRFRPIQPADEPFLYRVYASTRQEELAPVPWSEEQKAAFLHMQFLAQHRHYQQHFHDAEFLIVLQEDQPIGRLYVGRWREEIRIVDISLLPEHRNRGIGSMILRQLQQEAQREEKPLRIHVEKFNPARHLYERLGFVTLEDKGVYDFMEWRPPGG